MSNKKDPSLKAKPVVVSKAPKPIIPLKGSGYIRRPPACPPEWSQWAMMDRAEAWEAAALSINLEPRRIDPGKNSSFPDDATYELFNMRVRIVEGAPWPALGRNQFGVSLPDLAAWAVSKGLDIPSELASMAKVFEAPEMPVLQNTNVTSGAPENGELPAPVTRSEGKRGITKAEIIDATWPLPYKAPNLESILDKIPKWVDEACIKVGRVGKGQSGSHLWNPAMLAVCLATLTPHKRWICNQVALTNLIRSQFPDYLDEWTKKQEML